MTYTLPAALAAFFFGLAIGASLAVQFIGALCVEVVR